MGEDNLWFRQSQTLGWLDSAHLSGKQTPEPTDPETICINKEGDESESICQPLTHSRTDHPLTAMDLCVRMGLDGK